MASLSMHKLPWWGQLLVFAALGTMAIGAYYYRLEWPQREQLTVRQAELAAIQARIAAGLEAARTLPELRARVGDLESRLESLKAILPGEKDVVDLLRRIQAMASPSNLTIRTFRPQAMAQQDLHVEWPIGLELDGSYHAVGAFLDRISTFPRIITVGSIAMIASPSPSATASVRVSCTATTFVLTDRITTGAPAPAAPVRAWTPQPTPATPPEDLPTPAPNFAYRPEGRRDPFLDPRRSGSVAVSAAETRPSGAAGLLVDELSVRGIVRSQGAYVAMVSGPGGPTFTVRAGSPLFDGTVQTITPDAVVIQQQVTDPLSLQTQREVRRPLRVEDEDQ